MRVVVTQAAIALVKKNSKLKSERRGSRMKHTNLFNRTTDLVEYLEEYVIPNLNTTRKAQCSALVEHVKRLL